MDENSKLFPGVVVGSSDALRSSSSVITGIVGGLEGVGGGGIDARSCNKILGGCGESAQVHRERLRHHRADKGEDAAAASAERVGRPGPGRRGDER